MEETLEALDLLVRHGHVRYVGVSNWAAWHVAKALGICERRQLAPPRMLQAYYTVAGRDLEREIVPMLQSEKVGLMVWSPLAGGLLSGKYDRSNSGDGRRATFDFPPVQRDRAMDIIDAMRPMAEALPDPYRGTLIAAEFDDRPLRELAEAEGVSLSAIKSRASRGRRMLQEKLVACCRVGVSGAGALLDYDARAARACETECQPTAQRRRTAKGGSRK